MVIAFSLSLSTKSNLPKIETLPNTVLHRNVQMPAEVLWLFVYILQLCNYRHSNQKDKRKIISKQHQQQPLQQKWPRSRILKSDIFIIFLTLKYPAQYVLYMLSLSLIHLIVAMVGQAANISVTSNKS